MLTDRQRVEIALPARLWFGIAASQCFSNPNAAEVLELRALMKEAANAPLDGLVSKAADKIALRIDRAHDAVKLELYDRPALEVAVALFYFLEDLLAREILVLHEGSAFARGFEIIAPMFEDGFADEALDESARRAAADLLLALKALGYYLNA